MADFEVTFVDVGHGDATLIKIPGDRYVLVDIYRCPGEGIDLFKLLDDSLPDGDDGRRGHVHPSCRSDVRAIQPGVACGLCRNTYGAGTVGRRPRRRHIHRGLLERSSRSGDTLSGRQAAPRVLRPAMAMLVDQFSTAP